MNVILRDLVDLDKEYFFEWVKDKIVMCSVILQVIFAIISLVLSGVGLFKSRNESVKVKHVVIIIFLVMDIIIIFRGITMISFCLRLI